MNDDTRYLISLSDDDAELGWVEVDLRQVDAETLRWVRQDAASIDDTTTVALVDEVTLMRLEPRPAD